MPPQGGRSKAGLATVYQKHSSLRRGNPMYRGRRLANARRLRGGVSRKVQPQTEARVNAGRNSNGSSQGRCKIRLYAGTLVYPTLPRR